MKTKITEKNYKRVAKLVAKGIQDRYNELGWDELHIDIHASICASYAIITVWNGSCDYMTPSEMEVILEQVSAWSVRYDVVRYSLGVRKCEKGIEGEFFYTPAIDIYVG
jgi:hypothetical protein